MIVELLLLTLATSILITGLAFIGYRAEYLERKIEKLETELNSLKDKLEK